MARPMKLSMNERETMARAYVAGAPPSELATLHNVSMSYVINAARDWQTKESVKRLMILEERAQRRREQDKLRRLQKTPPLDPDDADFQPIHRKVTLPRVSIQHAKEQR